LWKSKSIGLSERRKVVFARTTAGDEIAGPEDHKHPKSDFHLTRHKPVRLQTHEGERSSATSIAGFILVFLGIISLAYFASPLRIMLRGTLGQGTINFVPIILGGLSLCSGIALLFLVRQKTMKN
jgi:hypothetical protein